MKEGVCIYFRLKKGKKCGLEKELRESIGEEDKELIDKGIWFNVIYKILNYVGLFVFSRIRK